MTDDILAERIKIEKHIKRWRTKLNKLQEACLHTSVVKTNHANTGNYDPAADRYWRVCHCPDCNKRWHEED